MPFRPGSPAPTNPRADFADSTSSFQFNFRRGKQKLRRSCGVSSFGRYSVSTSSNIDVTEK
jgi:hypothetical protein